MAQSVNKLTASMIKSLQDKGRYNDGNGLYLQISAAGAKSWIYRYKIFGKSREMGLGSTQVISLSKARALAQEAHTLKIQGIDPIQKREQEMADKADALASKPTFKECTENYISLNSSQWSNPKHRQQWGNTLKTYAFPIIGSMDIDSITTKHIVKILTPIWNEKNETATRTRGRIEKVIAFAKVQGLFKGDNPAVWKGHLDAIFASPSKVKKPTQRPSLPYTKVSTFFSKLQKRGGPASQALALQILTACRPSEASQARWEEFDLKSKVWTIPIERMKQKRIHRVALSDAAIELIENLPRFKDCPLLFPSPNKINKPLSENALNKVVRDLGYDAKTACAHGFRATFRTWATEQTNYPNDICEIALSHVNKDRVEAAYQRSDMLNKRFSLSNDWGLYCSKKDI